MNDDQGESANVVIGWRAIAFAALFVAVAALAALAVVASAQDADALATIALALAVLAFVIQIMVFIAQAGTAGQQMLQSERINAHTLSALSELTTRARGTESILARHTETAMKYAFQRSVQDARKEDLTPEETLERFRTYEDELEEEDGFEDQGPSETDLEILERLSTPPSEEEAPAAVELFGSLGPFAASSFDLLARDEQASRRAGIAPGVGARSFESPGVAELIDKGLAEPTEAPADDEALPRIRLTEEGRALAPIVLERGSWPTYLDDLLQSLVGNRSTHGLGETGTPEA